MADPAAIAKAAAATPLWVAVSSHAWLCALLLFMVLAPAILRELRQWDAVRLRERRLERNSRRLRDRPAAPPPGRPSRLPAPDDRSGLPGDRAR